MMYDLSRTERLHCAINAETTTGTLPPVALVNGRAALVRDGALRLRRQRDINLHPEYCRSVEVAGP